MEKTIYITEAQKNRLKKAIAAQDQVGGKVNAGIMGAVTGMVCEGSDKIQTCYRGYKSEFGIGSSDTPWLLWLTSDLEYAKEYGDAVMEYTNHYDSPYGGITIASDGESLTGLWFDGQKYYAVSLDEEHEEKDLPIFKQTKKWLDIYFGGKEPEFTPSLCMKTTEFRKAVWEISPRL